MGWRKHLDLFFAFAKTSFMADLEFRVNFTLRIVTDVFWYLAQIFTFEVLYHHTPIIGHWSLEQTRVFLGLLFVADSLYMIFLQDNLDRFSDKVRKGDLDLLLVKPINSQFMISFQKIALASLGNLMMSLGWLSWSLIQLENFSWVRLLWLLLLIPNGFLVFYAFRFCFAASAVIFTRSESLQFIWYQVYKLGTRPDSIYFPWMRYLILSAVPVALIASVPARALLDPPDLGLFLWSLLMGPLAVYVSSRYWKFCLKHYSSASS